MKAFIVLAAIVAVAFADVEVLSRSAALNEDGSYNWAFEQTDGTAANEAGVGGVSAKGGFRFTSPEGQNFQVSYVADENGFQPAGEHLPIAPAIPPQIARALEWIAAHPQKEKKA